MTTEQTPEQNKKLLAECEVTIKNGEQAFFAMAKAMLMIKQKKLFKPEYRSHSAYFADRWDMNKHQVSRYLDAAVLLEEMESRKVTQLPVNECQCRALLENQDTVKRQLELWDAVIKSGQKITGALIKKLANPQPETEPKTPKIPSVNQTKSEDKSDQKPEKKAEKKPEESISAKLLFAVDSGVWKDALEYMGKPCKEILAGDPYSGIMGLYEIEVTGNGKAGVLAELANWLDGSMSKVGITKVTIQY